MGIDWAHQLAEQLDRQWGGRFRPRLDGLTDAEYFWEPVASAWSIRPRGHGRAAIAAGGGGFVIDFGDGSAVTDGLKLAAYTGLAPGHPPVRHHPGL